MAVSFETILSRATAGKPLQRSQIFKPSWFYFMTQDPFWVWCEYHAPKSRRLDETSRFDQFRMDGGGRWEDQYVAHQYPNAYQVQAPWGSPALHETIRAMLRGETAIHGAALWLLGYNVYGQADVLVRCNDQASDLGNFHYRVKEVKNASKLKQYHQLQAATYHWILSKLQGYCPDSFDIVLGDGCGEETINYQTTAGTMRQYLAEWKAIRDQKSKPAPIALNTTLSPWRQYANELLTEQEHLSLLPGVGRATALTLRDQGFETLGDILDLGTDGCVREFNHDHHYYHALAYHRQQPVFRPGQSVAVRRKRRIVHFDVEDISALDGNLVTRPHTYMLGVATPDDHTKIWTARGQDDEARMWQDFLDWLGDPSDVALYCWTRYESTKLLQAATDHPVLATRLHAVQQALIDLKEEIKHRPYFPVSSYSIKSVAPVCGFHWSQGDVDGQSAQLMYIDWLQNGDDAIIQKVEQYNREDVLAMLAVDRYVHQISQGR
ncbi:MAG: TM0106 family RecB-like putative nuclease [Pirellulaceae bacterium]|nr:TM0106 family RecB-like putative nuclease [Pirellulaceae bacterium]